ncbi:unnamed protein product [Phytomonas sp. EM1]|nr:unnamed protein product [Phytomonas sp. EM1]|eukprot:CCW62423.1 unnamed protein product [Phytomonas sp. isolate EM1]
MDINEFLVKTTTAAEGGGASSEIWIKGKHKRKRSSQETEVTSYKEEKIPKTTHHDITGTDMKPTKTELTRERGANATSSAPASSTVSNSTPISSIMARLVIDYMFDRELGGRHSMHSLQSKLYGNYGRDDELMVSQLAAERASCSVVASKAVFHHLPTFQSMKDLRSSMKWENYPDAVVKYRRTLQVCDIRRDLIGGVTTEQTPHFRDFTLRIMSAALEGKTPQQERALTRTGDAQSGSSLSDKFDSCHDEGPKQFNKVHLSFQTSAQSLKVERDPQIFILDEFLNPSSSVSSESE